MYPNAGLVEAWLGLIAEDYAPGSSMGETMLTLWKREIYRLRAGDSYFYLAANVFSEELKMKIPRVQALFTGEDCFRAILLRTTDIKENELQQRLFFV